VRASVADAKWLGRLLTTQKSAWRTLRLQIFPPFALRNSPPPGLYRYRWVPSAGTGAPPFL